MNYWTLKVLRQLWSIVCYIVYHGTKWAVQGLWFFGSMALAVFLCDRFSMALFAEPVAMILIAVWVIYTIGYFSGHMHRRTKR